jgi:hypothetical protein
MDGLVVKLKKAILGISAEEALFSRRGFPGGTPEHRAHLENAGMTFVSGYNTGLQESDPKALMSILDQSDPEMTGFAYEGAAMALTILDLLTPWKRNRLHSFIDCAGDKHIYMLHVGAGWALARLKRSIKPFIEKMHPVFRWLVMDGYGFHQGYFHWKRFVEQKEMPAKISGYARRAFDQGLGRSMWFVFGADIERIPDAITNFSADRQADLWSGVGLACGYAGKLTDLEIENLHNTAAPFQPQMAQGAAFAAKARLRAGNLMDYTDRTCRIICGVSAQEAAQATDQTLENIPADGDEPAYEIWRSRLRERFSAVVRGGVDS